MWGVGGSGHRLQGDPFVSETVSSLSPTISPTPSLPGKVIFSQELGGPWCWLPAPCGPRKECFLGHSWSPQSWKPLETSLIASGSRGRDQDVWDCGSWALTRDVIAEVTSGEMFGAEASSHLCLAGCLPWHRARLPGAVPVQAAMTRPRAEEAGGRGAGLS